MASTQNWDKYLEWILPKDKSHVFTGLAQSNTQVRFKDWGPSQYKDIILLSIGITMLNIRRSRDRLVFYMGIPIPEKMVFILRLGPGVEECCQMGHKLCLPCTPCIMITVCDSLCFVVVWYSSLLSILVMVTSLAVGQTCDCLSASEATLKSIGQLKIIWFH